MPRYLLYHIHSPSPRLQAILGRLKCHVPLSTWSAITGVIVNAFTYLTTYVHESSHDPRFGESFRRPIVLSLCASCFIYFYFCCESMWSWLNNVVINNCFFRRPERWDTPPQEARVIPGLYSNTLTFLNGNPVGGNRACIGYKFALMEWVISRFVALHSIAFVWLRFDILFLCFWIPFFRIDLQLASAEWIGALHCIAILPCYCTSHHIGAFLLSQFFWVWDFLGRF